MVDKMVDFRVILIHTITNFELLKYAITINIFEELPLQFSVHLIHDIF